jgi:fatty acid desaturase
MFKYVKINLIGNQDCINCMISKFLFNKVLLTLSIVVFICSWIFIFNVQGYVLILFWIINLICIHYLFTVVHQSSHGLLDKNTKLNYFFGFIASFFTGVTFADFKFTHDLHHKHIGDPKNDPDHEISGSGPVLLIPFKIWYHDKIFLLKNKDKYLLFLYLLQRIMQIILVIIVFFGNQNLFIYFWLMPILFIGIANALFLFYFPHYTHWIEKTSFNIYPLKESIRLSRFYHHSHHDKPYQNSYFFPFEANLLKIVENKIQSEDKNFEKYFY